MRKLYTTKLINRPEMKFYLVLDYKMPSTWPKSTQAEIQNDGGSLGLVSKPFSVTTAAFGSIVSAGLVSTKPATV